MDFNFEYQACPLCKGKGRDENFKPCLACKGTGRIKLRILPLTVTIK